MIVISDTSPLVAFGKLEQFCVLRQLFEKILIPPAVYNEYLKDCPDSLKIPFLKVVEDFIEVVEVMTMKALTRNLGIGEREAIALVAEK